MGKKIFFQARDCYSKIFIIIKGVKMKLRIITRKYAFDTAIHSATKSILRLWSSQRQPAGAGVDLDDTNLRNEKNSYIYIKRPENFRLLDTIFRFFRIISRRP